jgi:hypothetical protein
MTNDILFSLWSQARPSFLTHGLSRDFYIAQIIELELRPGRCPILPCMVFFVFVCVVLVGFVLFNLEVYE